MNMKRKWAKDTYIRCLFPLHIERLCALDKASFPEEPLRCTRASLGPRISDDKLFYFHVPNGVTNVKFSHPKIH